MALERKDIVKTDFPTARRGYALEAVDAHLWAIADEVEALKKARAPRRESVAAGASEQVRQIVEAAEASAAEIRAGAEREAKAVRAEATAEGHEHVARVSRASERLIERVGEMEAEVKRLVTGLATQLGAADAEAVAARTRPEPDEDDIAVHAVDAAVEPEPEAEPKSGPEPAAEERPKAAAGDDSEGARLIALNMALSGTPRDETDRYLSENFELADRAALLDEVYARVGG